jgi:hypothetical protein
MGRRKNAIAPDDEKAVVAMDKQQKEIEKAEELYGDGLPFDQFRLETGIKARTAASIGMMIQNGRDYHRLKAHLPHGEFIACVERTSGKSRDWAWRCMKVAETVANIPQMSTEVDILNIGQFRALTVFEKPVVEEYRKGGPLGDIPHDDVATMPRSDLEAEARRLRKKLEEEVDSREAVIQEKENKINEMDRRLRGQEPPTKEQLAQGELEGIGKEFVKQLVDAADAMDKCKLRILAAQRVEGVSYQLLQDWQLLYNDYIKDVKDTLQEMLALIDDLHPDTDTGLGA